jgi:hypothetical protein
MIEDPVAEHREVTEVVFTGADLISGSPESKRAKVSETLLNILEGRVTNSNTRKAYKTAWRSFFAFCSEYKLELDRVKPYHFGLWLIKAAYRFRRYPTAALGRRSPSVRSPA